MCASHAEQWRSRERWRSPGANGIVVFVHGSGSSRHSPRNQFVARVIRESGNGTLLFDLLTADEEIEDNFTRRLRFDIDLLANRLVEVTRWLVAQPTARQLGIGYFGSSTGGGAALVAAAEVGQRYPRCGLTWRTPRSRRRRAAARLFADAAHRRRIRSHGDRTE